MAVSQDPSGPAGRVVRPGPDPSVAAPEGDPVPVRPLLDDVDALLDEIDDLLEDDAEEFVRGYVQKGGE